VILQEFCQGDLYKLAKKKAEKYSNLNTGETRWSGRDHAVQTLENGMIGEFSKDEKEAHRMFYNSN